MSELEILADAVELRPGGIYIIRPSADVLSLDQETVLRIRKQLDAEENRLGVKFMLLDNALELVRDQSPRTVIIAEAGTGIDINLGERTGMVNE